MASLTQNVLFCGLVVFACIISSNSVRIDIDPEVVPDDYKGNLTITCDASDLNMTSAFFIQLRKTTPLDDDVPVAELFPGQGAQFVDPSMNLRAQTEGSLNVKNRVYLTTTFNEVTTAEYGTYSCMVSYLDAEDHIPATSTVSGQVSTEPVFNFCLNVTMPAIENITMQIVDLKQEIEDLKNMNVTAQCCKETIWESNSNNSTVEVVAFSYRVLNNTDEVPFDNKAVPFTQTLFETHNMLEETTHSIIVPKSGIYEVALTMAAGKSSANGYEADLVVDSIPQASLLVDSTRSSTLTVLVKLMQGQELQVVGKGDDLFAKRFSYISGHLVAEL